MKNALALVLMVLASLFALACALAACVLAGALVFYLLN